MGADDEATMSQGPTPSPERSEPELNPTTIGPYRVIRPLGQGGFGVVYLAEQREPVRRHVAIKLLRPFADSRQVLSRFEAERQALAMMEHPGIARVFDAGMTVDGQSYFVMEYVRGGLLTEFCSGNDLDVRERLDLFRQLCDAVQHAHTKGVVHRDLKPSNVLVTTVNNKPFVKVIDFGVAKAMEEQLSTDPVMTAEGQIIGTPMYMSPEQAGGDTTKIDTRSDVYALGVILYELMTGSPPFDESLMRSAAMHEWVRMIREETPPKPSTRLLSDQRHSQPIAGRSSILTEQTSRFAQSLRRDLDWVIMKCLEKPRERRYQSPGELSEEIRRYLRGDPVSAGPPTLSYRLRKLAGRHRAATAAALTTAGVVVFGGVTSGVFAAREGVARRDAEAALAVAEREEQVSTAITEFLTDDLILSATPGVDGPDLRVVEVLERGLASLDNRFSDQPDIRGRLRATLARALLALGNLSQAGEELDSALEELLLAEALEPTEQSSLLIEIAEVEWRTASLDKALARIQSAEQLLTQSGLESTVAYFSVLNARANALKYAGRINEAGPLYERVIEGRARLLGADTLAVIQARYNHALLPLQRALAAQREGRPEDTRSHQEQGLMLMTSVRKDAEQNLGREHPETLAAWSEELLLLRRLGRLTEALDGYAELMPTMRQSLGDRHWRTLDTLANYGKLCETAAADAADPATRLGQLDRAVALYDEAVEGYEEIRGPAHAYTVVVGGWLADVYVALNRNQDAADVLEKLFVALVEAGSDRSREHAQRIATVYEMMGQGSKASAWRNRASGD